MLAALAEVMAEKGYVATSVADIIRVAGVSRETFYQQFTSKQDCFVAGFDEQRLRLLAATAAAVPARGTPLELFAAAVGAYLDGLAEHPALARLYLIEVWAAGPEVMARRAEMQQSFVDGMALLLRARTKRERFACEALVAAIVSMVTTRLAAGETDSLRSLRDPFVALAERQLS